MADGQSRLEQACGPDTVTGHRSVRALSMPVEFAFVFAGAAIAITISLAVALWFERSKSTNESDR